MSRAYIGLGSNLEQPQEQLRRAMSELRSLAVDKPKCSSLYCSAPVGVAAQPDFINACCRIDTALEPEVLLDRLLEIEAIHGRQRLGVRGNARTLDLDLLLYDERVQSSPKLVLPHPRLHERAFVLYPLLEIDPDLWIPGHGPVTELVRRCANQRIARLNAGGVGEGKPKHGA